MGKILEMGTEGLTAPFFLILFHLFNRLVEKIINISHSIIEL